MKIYTAGSINGLNYDVVKAYYKEIRVKLELIDYEVLQPIIGKEYVRTEKKFKAQGDGKSPLSTNHSIFGRDMWMVRQCDIILVNLTLGIDFVSIGSVMELAVASSLGKLCITIMQEENIHQHAFVLEASDTIVESMDEAIPFLRMLSMGE